METKLTTKQAIEEVLTGKRKALTVAQIAEAAIPLTGLDVQSVGEELASATCPDRFAPLLAELVELCTRDRLLARTGDGELATGELLISVERA